MTPLSLQRNESGPTLMDNDENTNADQDALWNGPGGDVWVRSQPLLDDTFRPFERRLVGLTTERRPKRLLDVGCGTGSTTIAMARGLASEGACTGIDISKPMLETAKARATEAGLQIQFINADAQTHAFDRNTFDMIASRFGVMFFADPTQAFTNLKWAATDDCALHLFVWRRFEENPFMTVAETAAAHFFPDLPPRENNKVGQFGFADDSRVRSILERSGWSNINISEADE
ncbi:MAG: class I SAM-dependent methyltransferase, partial [Pseudomonadota bacterium]